MPPRNSTFIAACILYLLAFVPLLHADFFTIDIVSEAQKPQNVHRGKNVRPVVPPPKAPWLEVQLRTKDSIAGESAYAKAYFFDAEKKLVATMSGPTQSDLGWGTNMMPAILNNESNATVHYEIPKEVDPNSYHAVIVFGDKDEATARCYPMTVDESLFDYPDKKLVEDRTRKNVMRKKSMNPLIEYVAQSSNIAAKHPQMTLFLRMPNAVSDVADIQGVMAICVLANTVDDIRRELMKPEMSGDYDGLFSYANSHKLAMLVWGATPGTWDPAKNYNEMAQTSFLNMEDSLDELADTWEKGVIELSEKYGIPKKDYLLWGICGAAQWAQRLCLRKPDYFLATYLIIPSSFDKPTQEAKKVIWGVSTGERFWGYERGLAWFRECRDMGYPMIFKAWEGMGHDLSDRRANNMAFQFFDFAMTLKDQRDNLDTIMANRIQKAQFEASEQAQGPWPEVFRHPSFYGDVVNQDVYSPEEVEMIPAGFRTALPTKELADYWLEGK